MKTCVAGGCNKSDSDDEDEVLRKKWIHQVKRHRDKLEPTEYSVFCSLHFKQSCFTADTILTQLLGLGKKKATLKPDAVLTLFTREVALKRKLEMVQPPPKKRRSMYKKCEHCRVSLNLLITS